MSDALQGVGPLTRFAWEFRYPAESEPPSAEHASAWVVKVKQVLNAVEGALPRRILP